MNNYKQPPRGRRQTMDGIIGAPSRSQPIVRPFARHGRVGDGLRTSGRTIGDFKQPEGYRPANTSTPSAFQPSAIHPAAEQSLLNTTLPAGKGIGGLKFNDKDKKGNKKRFRI